MTWLVRWRLALRIARREAVRHRGRTALVLAMVGLPVLAVVGADTFFRTSEVSTAEQAEIDLGSADARITGVSREQVYADPAGGTLWAEDVEPADPPWTVDEVTAALPAGSRVAETLEGGISYRTTAGRAAVLARTYDADDPVLDGLLTLAEGRFPEGSGELAISGAVADRGSGLGDTLQVTGDDVPARVVGVLRQPPGNADPFLVLSPESAELLADPVSRFLATVPGGLDWPAVQELNSAGLVVVSREVAADPPAAAEWLPPDAPRDVFENSDVAGHAVLALVVASVVLEVVLLAGPAFAVGVRRQRRDLALIAATGGSPADLRRVVLSSGVVLGGAAALVGATLGVAAAAVAVPLVESWTGRVSGPFDVPFIDVLVTVAVGLSAGLAAAYVPARQAARTDVVDTLAGRRGQVRSPWRSPLIGLVVATTGLVLVVLGARGTELGVAGGAVLLIVGLVVATPWLVGLLAPLARRLPVAGRLAVRDATRNRARTAPAMAAVMATVAGVTALAIGSNSDSVQGKRDYLPSAPMGTATITAPDLDGPAWADVEDLVREQAPGRTVHRLQTTPWTGERLRDIAVLRPGCSGELDECRWFLDQPVMMTGGYGEVVVLTPEAARALSQDALGDDVARVLEAGRIAVLGGSRALDPDGAVVLAGTEYVESPQEAVGTVTGTVRLPAEAVAVPSRKLLQLPGMVLVPPQLAGRLPVEVTTVGMVAGGPDDPVTPAQERELRETLELRSDTASLTVERGWQDPLAVARYVLFGLGGLLVLVATLTATGLALTDARPDFATLAAVGAAPRTRRFMAMASAAVVGGGGALLGLLAGMAPGIAIAYPLTAEDNWGTGGRPLVDIPWLLLGGVGVLVPLLAVALTGVFVRSRLPMSRRVA